MVEITDEMVDAAAQAFTTKPTEATYIVARRMIEAALKIHEANKPKHEPVLYVGKQRLQQALSAQEKFVTTYTQPTQAELNSCDFVPLYATPPQEPLSNNMESNDMECDICNKEVGYHVKHFSSEDDPHIHVCDDCIKNLGLEIYLVPPVSMLKESLDLQNSN